MSTLSTPNIGVPTTDPPLDYSAAGRRRGGFDVDRILRVLTGSAAVTICAMVVVLLGVLTYSARESIRTYGLGFLLNSEWRPNEVEVPKLDAKGKIIYEDGEMATVKKDPAFGAAAVIWGTAASSAMALVFAVPLSLGAALFLILIAPKFLVTPVSFLIELLAAIPSIAFGMWGLFVLAPFLQSTIEPNLFAVGSHIPLVRSLFVTTQTIGGVSVTRPLATTGQDLFCGALILAIMVLPIITAISRDVLRAVPRTQLEGAVALGATWWQSAKEMLRFARAGLFGAIMLGLSRAAGETMAIAMVIGNKNQITLSPFAPAQTMSSLLANSYAEAGVGVHTAALAEVALILLLMSLIFNVVARWLIVGNSATARGAGGH